MSCRLVVLCFSGYRFRDDRLSFHHLSYGLGEALLHGSLSFIRLSYAASTDALREGLTRLRRFVENGG